MFVIDTSYDEASLIANFNDLCIYGGSPTAFLRGAIFFIKHVRIILQNFSYFKEVEVP